MSEQERESLKAVASTLAWLAELIEDVAAGERQFDKHLIRCFMFDWAGMTVFGTARVTADFAGLMEEAEVQFREQQAADEDEHKHTCTPER